MIKVLRTFWAVAALTLALSIPFILASPANAQTPAPACGEFTPMIGVAPPYDNSPFRYVHYFPKHCNNIMVSGAVETIPSGTGVISGGVVGDTLSACIDKICGQTLAPNTLYRAFVFKDGGVLKMDFSTGGHREDPTYGNQVHASDPARSLVGMVYTDGNSLLVGSANKQLTSSWFNRGTTQLGAFIGWGGNPVAQTCSTTLVPVGIELEFLTWGINDTFKQAFTVPSIEVSGTVQNNVANNYVHAAVGIAHAGTGWSWAVSSHIGAHYQNSPPDAGTVHSIALGAAGADEGLVKVSLMLSTGGSAGCAIMTHGTLYASPLES